MELMLKKMRADFEMVANARKEAGEWTAADVAEFGKAIKTAVDSGDANQIALWARWLADLSTGVVFFSMVVRAAESAMRAKAGLAK